MATNKTLQPTNQQITIAAFSGEKPDQRQIADAESKMADAINALSSQLGTSAYGVANSALTVIPSGADLDNYTTPGSYISRTASISASLSHTPVTIAGFSLHVESIGGGTGQYVLQTIKVNGSSCDQYIRYNATGEWMLLTPVTVKQYSATTETNANVSPWGAYCQISIPSEERNLYGNIFSVATHSASTNPSMGAITSGEGGVMIYSKSPATFNISVGFIKKRTT